MPSQLLQATVELEVSDKNCLLLFFFWGGGWMDGWGWVWELTGSGSNLYYLWFVRDVVVHSVWFLLAKL